MSDAIYDELASLHDTAGPTQALQRLVETLGAQKNYHKRFDARMLQRKHELGLSLARPASLSDVPAHLRKQVEETYIEAAREAGEAFLQEGDIPNAWMYLQVIREPQKVREALEALPLAAEPDDATEQIMRLALYEGLHPTKGVQMMLRLHGTCSTITALDQAMANLPQEDRQACAQLMVRTLYEDLRGNIERDVQRKIATLPPGSSLRELIAARDWLFEGGNYHIDVSHLSSVVRFARSIESREELQLALELAEYGSRLDSQLQYGGDPPFEDFYPAHLQFFKALLGRDREAALDYFREKLAAEPDERDQPLLAYVLVDLLMRTGQLDEAVDVAAKHLINLGEDMTFSFADLCRQAGRLETLRDVMRRKDDPVAYTAALLAPT